MRDDDLEPFDAEVRRVIALDVADEGVPAVMRTRLATRLAGELGRPLGDARSGEPHDPPPGASGPSGGAGPSLASWKLALALAFGGALGAAGHAVVAEPRVVYVTSEAPLRAPPEVLTSTPEPPEESAVPSAPGAAPPRAPLSDAVATPLPAASARRAPHASEGELSAERALVEVARAALSRHDYDGALAASARHAARYPEGQLREEREALAIQALAASGRAADARTRAAAFRRRYPRSMLAPVVDQALGPGRDR